MRTYLPCVLIAVVMLGAVFAACDNGSGGGPAYAPLVITGKDFQSTGVTVTFTAGRDAPREGAPLVIPESGDSYVITLDGETLSQGKIAVTNGTNITFIPKTGERFEGTFINNLLRFAEDAPVQGFVQTAPRGGTPVGTPGGGGGGGGGGAVTYTVTFDANGGTAVPSSATAPLDGTGTVDEPATTRDGYEFAGWYSDTDLTIPYDFSTLVTGNFTLYAKWTPEIVPYITISTAAQGAVSDFYLAGSGEASIDWGDGNTQTVTLNALPVFPTDMMAPTWSIPHSYADAGTKTIRIEGDITGLHAGRASAIDTLAASGLKVLILSTGTFSILDLGGNPVLEHLHFHSTGLNSLDVSRNSALESLDCSGTRLPSLDVSGNPALQALDCSGTGLTILDVSGNPALEWLNCSGTGLTSLDASGNHELEYLNCRNNPGLTSLDVSGASALQELYCDNTGLTSLDVSGNTALHTLVCINTGLRSLDLSENPVLQVLDCSGNPSLTSLDVRRNTALEWLRCHYNTGLTSLDVSENRALRELSCYNTGLTILDVSRNPALEWLDCSSTGLPSLDVHENPALQILNCRYADMDKTALEALFGSLRSGGGTTGTLFCRGNPGYDAADKNIAIDKGWIVD